MSANPFDMPGASVTEIESVASRIEGAFARVGGQLGQGHTIFKELNRRLGELSLELSSTEIEGAASALQQISGRLNELAAALPAETALLEAIGKGTADASSLLKPLFKHIQLITIIARSARIEAASLDGDREGFLAFTQEAYALGKAVQQSIEDCARDQQRLSDAVTTAYQCQRDFEQRYRDQLIASSSALTAAYAELREQRGRSSHLAEVAGGATRTIAEAVAGSIVSLQAGDSTRQRLEHVCHGLGMVPAAGPSLVPEPEPEQGAGLAQAICQLQAAQLKDAEQEFQDDIARIVQSLAGILRAAGGVVDQGRSIFGGEVSSSFLSRIKETLAQASALITTCENAGRSVDAALAIVEGTLSKFRTAISGLAEAAVDITLIGMNAGLRAGHLGAKGSAFVVIANELQATADQVSQGTSRLKPALDVIERSSSELRELRVHGDPARLAELEPQVMQALREIEVGNQRLQKLMGELAKEGTAFEELMVSAQSLMTGLSDAAMALPRVATQLDAACATLPPATLRPRDEAALAGLYARYTMERERDTHRHVLRRLGVAAVPAAAPTELAEAADDGIEFF